MKIRPVEPVLFRADGQTDMTKLTAVFRDIANALKKMTCFTKAGDILHW